MFTIFSSKPSQKLREIYQPARVMTVYKSDSPDISTNHIPSVTFTEDWMMPPYTRLKTNAIPRPFQPDTDIEHNISARTFEPSPVSSSSDRLQHSLCHEGRSAVEDELASSTMFADDQSFQERPSCSTCDDPRLILPGLNVLLNFSTASRDEKTEAGRSRLMHDQWLGQIQSRNKELEMEEMKAAISMCRKALWEQITGDDDDDDDFLAILNSH
ncbi:hypothetical protein CLAIMM_08557 [Cladophialophora immunda]|nr:hypothetical protein CLAIMM_08557 [Cladophialophora immunda]